MVKEDAIPDAVVAEIARRQHGIVTFEQLAAAGLWPNSIALRVRAGRLHRVHRGVYAVGHAALSHRGHWIAAALAGGSSAVLSHASAAQLWGLLPAPPAKPGPVHITVGGDGGRRSRRGIVVHRSATLIPADVTRRFCIPVTRPARTLADLKRVLGREQVETAVDRARSLRLSIGDRGDGDQPTRSKLERRFLALCRRHRLPKPEVNVGVGPFLVDFLWRDQRLVVETDGFEHHRSRASFEADRARDARLKLMGYDVVRFTHRQVVEDPARVAATLRALLRCTESSPAGAL
jgi:very-short-patch-repair endonuclease